MVRTPCCEKVGLKRGRWTEEEDEKLTNYILCHGEGSWRSLPKNAGLLRCGKSCRLRWINYLRSDLKRGNITPQEEDIIIKLHATLGNRWSAIAGQLSGRTDNEIKNYWNSHLSRRIHTFRSSNGEENVIKLTNVSAPAKRRGGRTSKATMQRIKSNDMLDEIANDKSTSPTLESDHIVVGENVMFDKDSKELMGIEDNIILDRPENHVGPDEINGLNVGLVRADQEHYRNEMGGGSTATSTSTSTSSSSSFTCFDHFDWDMQIGMIDYNVGVNFQSCSEKGQIASLLWDNDYNYLEDQIWSNMDIDHMVS